MYVHAHPHAPHAWPGCQGVSHAGYDCTTCQGVSHAVGERQYACPHLFALLIEPCSIIVI